MKITIELNENELKSLMFLNEETNNKQTKLEQEFVYESMVIANQVLSETLGIAIDYGFVRVSEFKDISESLSNVKTLRKYIDNLYGWTYNELLSKARIISLKSGYTIILPEPMRIV